MAKEFDESGPKVEMALYFAEVLHWYVFPLVPNKKIPAIKKWETRATTDTNQIKAWWARNPDYNIAIRTGNGLCCVDMDTKNEGENGLETFHDWQVKNGVLPDTLRARTPTGSIHAYYRTRQDYGHVNHNHDGSTFFEDIDVHNDTLSYMVGPGSTINGEMYMFEAGCFPDEIELAEETETLTKFIRDAFLKPSTKPAETSTKSEGKTSEKYEKVKMPDKIKAGERHNQIVSLACSLRAQELSESAILSAITAENEEKCEPPKWTEKDLKKLVEWVMTKDTSEAQIEAEKLKKKEAQTEAQAEKENALTDALTSLDAIEETEAEWLIPGILPKGQICLLVGDGGVGKTWLWCNLAASISAGEKCILDDPNIPFKVRDPAKVMFFSSEDSVGTVLKARLAKAGANFSNITTITLENELFEQVRFDNPALKALLERVRPELCIFDPIQGFIPSTVRMAERNAMRQTLTPLIGYGEEFGTTFLLVCHSNKRAGAWGRARVADSADIWDIARAVLLLGETEDEGIKYINQGKNNYGPCAETILFSITPEETLKFEGVTKKTDRDYVLSKEYSKRSQPERDEAKTAIENTLAFNGGHMLTSDLEEQVIQYGIKGGTYNRARAQLLKDGVIESKKIGMKNWYTATAGWYESLTDEEKVELAKPPQEMPAENEVNNLPETEDKKTEQLTLDFYQTKSS